MKLNQVLSVFSSRSVSRHATGSWKRHSGLKVGPLVLTVVAISGSDVDRMPVDGEGCFHHGFAEGGVRVDVAAHLPGVALEELGQRRLGDELGRARADDVGAEKL